MPGNVILSAPDSLNYELFCFHGNQTLSVLIAKRDGFSSFGSMPYFLEALKHRLGPKESWSREAGLTYVGQLDLASYSFLVWIELLLSLMLEGRRITGKGMSFFILVLGAASYHRFRRRGGVVEVPPPSLVFGHLHTAPFGPHFSISHKRIRLQFSY